MTTAYTRRGFLGLIAAGAASAACSGGSGNDASGTTSARPATTTTGRATTTTTAGVALPGDPFTLGVASGDPLTDSVILWTRLAPDAPSGGGMPADDIAVRWEVASDEAFTRIVADGMATATPDHAHALHVDAAGLDPATEYWYRFSVAGFTSPTGRTLTAPDGTADSLRLAVASCQDWQDGYYTSYPHLVGEGVDLVVFLGDYIYESGPTGTVRDHGTPEVVDLAGYRNRYRLYKGDAGLQAAHAAAPWVVTWDDHEVDNNYTGGDPTFATERMAAAYQAWWEHQPVRLDPPDGLPYAIHRSVAWGDLATFFVLDGRQYRALQACGGELGAACPEIDDPARTMLGGEQEAWVLDGFAAADQPLWTVLANDVVMSDSTAQIGEDRIVNPDQWDGYPEARRRLLQGAVDAGVANLVTITGDIHARAVGDIALTGGGEPSVVGTEFVGTSISSEFPATLMGAFQALAALSPYARYTDPTRRGYMLCTVTRDDWRTDFRTVDTVTTPESPIATTASWIVDVGAPGAHPA